MSDTALQPRPVFVRDAAPNPELLQSLGRLVRGLSMLFWGLPLALVVCVLTANGDMIRTLGVLPAFLATGLLLSGLCFLGHFQRQERPWRAVLDRALVLAVINFGLSPFLYWWSRVPSHPFLGATTQALVITGLLFLIALNPVLVRLTAMLPDEALRQETRLFTAVNRFVLAFILLVLAAWLLAVRFDPGLPDRFMGWLLRISPFPQQINGLIILLDHGRHFVLLFLVLLPLAMTMALLWKIKEVILASVFGHGH